MPAERDGLSPKETDELIEDLEHSLKVTRARAEQAERKLDELREESIKAEAALAASEARVKELREALERATRWIERCDGMAGEEIERRPDLLRDVYAVLTKEG